MNLARLQEAISAAFPDRECLIFGDRRFTWAELNDRTRRLAAFFRSRGLGLKTERAELENWQSGQSHIALYMHNCNEYMEGMLAAFKTRATAVNVNYRYQNEELLYLLRNSRSEAIVFHGRFAERLAEIKQEAPAIKTWIQVDDGAGAPLLDGAVEYEALLAQSPPEPPDPDCSPDDLVVIYTGGTTGLPKGVLWRQEDLFFALLSEEPFGSTVDDIVANIRRRIDKGSIGKAMPLAPMMHASGSCMGMSSWFRGNALVLQKTTDRFDGPEIVETIERERVNHLTLIGDAFALPLLEEMERRPCDMSSVEMINSGGAILSEHNKRRLLTGIPGVLLLDAVGSSEAGRQAFNISRGDAATSSVDFRMAPGACVISAAKDRVLEPGDEEIGWVAQGGPVALGYLGDQEKTETSFPTIDGKRYAVPGDRARLNADGGYRFLGRESITINSGGEKIFAEEVEAAIKRLEGVLDAQVIGVKDQQWGQKVVAIVEAAGAAGLDAVAVQSHCKTLLAGYKAPKDVLFVDRLHRAPNGKPDFDWARDLAARRLAPKEAAQP